MGPQNGTYSSAQLRERDQRVNETRQQEIDSLNTKNQKLRQNYDSVSSELFAVANRERRLVEDLGFESVYEAHVAIESTDFPISFRNCMERVQTAEAQLQSEKKEVELLQAKLRDVEGENKLLKVKHHTLESRFDSMAVLKTRAAERYKSDFKVWKGIHNWLYAEGDDPIDQTGLTPEAIKKLQKARLLKRRQQLLERSPIPPPTDPEEFEAQWEKENEGTPMPPNKKRRILSVSSSASTNSTTPTLPLRSGPLKSVTNMAPPSCSPTVFHNPDIVSTTRVPLTFQPIPKTIVIDKEPSCTPSPINDGNPSRPLLHSSPLSAPHMPASSDTEDDSQAVFLPSNSTPAGRLALFKVPAPPPPKTGPSQYQTPSRFSDPILPNRTTIAQSSHARSALWDPAMLDINRTTNTHQKSDERSANAPRPSDHGTTPATKPRNQPMNFSSSVKGKEREVEPPFSTPLTSRNVGQKRLEDYSAFKGRGGYGKADEAAQPTINAVYTIDPTQNGGVNYQYDEVVRRREDRRKMDAGDCECCREYYEKVGALPNRLQQPLWRSPPTTPARPCPRHSHSPENRQDSEGKRSNHRPSAARRQSDIESHKKAISRHRHNWARARTPPGYWDIGFPNTQEVGDINQKAKEMHKRKKDDVEREAGIEGGKYRRK
ncbi:hypothetical protein M413DRAFT_243905 [Hebeloma cylindrosporum]|uniref:DNA endonuclease activator Ctp1 C-terminal domain-containing protein n=1 Tax=Hebeloma cylindrosporum TaxID=76867 RepID=A0A0C3C2W5_HEBCY|nr:hypothetical protein M413DRAFT_243905 [Hebeloma cylindrosporum h7]